MSNFKLRVKFGDFEYDAEGDKETVCEQFSVFQRLCESHPQLHFQSDFQSPKTGFGSGPKVALPVHADPEPLSSHSPDFLPVLLAHDPLTATLTCRVLPSGPTKTADTLLLLLLGHQVLLGQQETSAMTLNQALSGSGGTVGRLDRILATYLKNHWILKSGKGKGGKYRLSKLGVHEARKKAEHLVNLLPEQEK